MRSFDDDNLFEALRQDAAQVANHRLIAAAPAMLKALHDVWVLASALDIGNHERSMLREAVSAAIDAAEGRAQTVPR